MKAEKLSRRDFLRLGALTAAGVALFGCAPTPTPQAPAATATTAPEATATTAAEATATMAPEATATTAAAAGARVPISFWNMPFVTQEVSPDYVKQWENAVVSAVPDASVDSFFGPGDYGTLRQKFLLQAKSGTPDVIEGLLEDTAVYVKNGLIDDLDSRFNAWADKDQFVTATVDPLRINGKLYGIPYNTNARALIYRTDIFEQNNLQVPTTWTEMVDTARNITKLTNKKTFGFYTCTLVGDPRAPQEFISWYYQVSNGKHMFDTSGESPQLIATAADFEKILTLYNDLFTGDYPACDPNQKGTGWPVEDPGYVAGKWAMCPMGPWLWGRRTESDMAKDILVNKTEIVELPIPEGGGHYTYLEVKPIMLNHYSAHPDVAWQLIQFICSKEEMGLWLASSGGVPARKDALTIPEFQGDIAHWIQGFAKLLAQGVALAPVNWGPVNEANLKAVNYVIYEQKTPKEAAQWLYDEIKGFETNKTL